MSKLIRAGGKTMAAKNREFPNPGALSTNLTVGELRPQVTLYKYRVYMKKSPNFLTLEMAPLSTLMPLHEQHREGRGSAIFISSCTRRTLLF